MQKMVTLHPTWRTVIKANSWVSFNFHIWDVYGALLGGPLGCWSSTTILISQLERYLVQKCFKSCFNSQRRCNWFETNTGHWRPPWRSLMLIQSSTSFQPVPLSRQSLEASSNSIWIKSCRLLGLLACPFHFLSNNWDFVVSGRRLSRSLSSTTSFSSESTIIASLTRRGQNVVWRTVLIPFLTENNTPTRLLSDWSEYHYLLTISLVAIW